MAQFPHEVLNNQYRYQLERPVPIGHVAQPLPPHPALLVEELEIQHVELHRLVGGNRMLVEDRINFERELAAAKEELRRLNIAIGDMHAEQELQSRELIERSQKLETDLRSNELLKNEAAQLRIENQKLVTSRQDLSGQIEALSQELAKLRSDNQQISVLRSEFNGLHQELLQARSAVDYEKKANVELLERRQAMETNLASVARELEMHRAELAISGARTLSAGQYLMDHEAEKLCPELAISDARTLSTDKLLLQAASTSAYMDEATKKPQAVAPLKQVPMKAPLTSEPSQSNSQHPLGNIDSWADASPNSGSKERTPRGQKRDAPPLSFGAPPKQATPEVSLERPWALAYNKDPYQTVSFLQSVFLEVETKRWEDVALTESIDYVTKHMLKGTSGALESNARLHEVIAQEKQRADQELSIGNCLRHELEETKKQLDEARQKTAKLEQDLIVSRREVETEKKKTVKVEAEREADVTMARTLGRRLFLTSRLGVAFTNSYREELVKAFMNSTAYLVALSPIVKEYFDWAWDKAQEQMRAQGFEGELDMEAASEGMPFPKGWFGDPTIGPEEPWWESCIEAAVQAAKLDHLLVTKRQVEAVEADLAE